VDLARRMNRIGIPPQFAHATLENYIAGPATYPALMTARGYAEEFIPGQTHQGLMFTGPVGTGKTHLAVGILGQLVSTKGIEARMIDMRDLFEQLRSSYDRRDADTQESHRQILRPIFQNDLLLIDELGAAKFSDWVEETIELVIGRCYNEARPLLVTTNLANRPAGAEDNPYVRAARPVNLGDRIGMRMWSRLQQMCRVVQVIGPDWRTRESE
jgi:DNA replication protein DnaC